MQHDLAKATWHDLTEEQPWATKTPIEQALVKDLPPMLQAWRREGYLHVTGAVPHDVLDAYTAKRAELPKDRSAKDNFWGGWAHPTPFMDCPELLDVATWHELQHAMWSVIGDHTGLHLALTGWVSTERAWHQDSYLNPASLWSHYIAAWIALEDVHEDAGPFELVMGSHLWRTLRRDKLFQYLTPEQRCSPDWPTTTQDHVARVCQEEIERTYAVVGKFFPKKGDVLLWHSNLVHRGSAPKDPSLLRKALICHYSAVTRRLDMKSMKRNPTNGILYFDFP